MDENAAARVVVVGRIPAEQRAELERRAAASDRTSSWLVRQAVDHYLERELESEGER